MYTLKTLTSSLLLLTTPSMLLYPQNSFTRTHFQEQEINYTTTERDYVLSYDDMLRLLDEIEAGELENRCTPEDLEKIAYFIAFLAKEGALPDNSEESLTLESDIEELLNQEDNLYQNAISFVTPGEYQYLIVPALLNGQGEVILCKSWIKKKCKRIKKFVKKHKKAVIIGTAVIVASAVVVVAFAAVSSATAGALASGTAGGIAAASSDNKAEKKDHKEESSSFSVPTDMSPTVAATHEAPTLKSTIDYQVYSFKENLVENEFFPSKYPATNQQGLSWEENGRALASLFAHDTLNNLQHQIPCHPRLAQEIQDIHLKYTSPLSGENQGIAMGHFEIDRKFSTDYSYLYLNPAQEFDLNFLSHQIRGEKALAFGYYNQAIQDLGKAIEANPAYPLPYLERGIAHFGLGQYDHSLEDYKKFTSIQKTNPLSVSEFSLGFAKGLPQGIYESGEGVLLFLADFVTHPIHTAGQVIDSVTTLVDLVRTDEWGIIGEVLSPEIHELVTQWETLSSDKKGELAGYAVGKHGADILIPGALTKIASKSLKSAQELIAVCKNFEIAQETLLLETASEIGNSAKIAEVVRNGQTTAFLGEELGFTAREMGQLKQAG